MAVREAGDQQLRPLMWWDTAAGLTLAVLGTLGVHTVVGGNPLWAGDAPPGARLALAMLPLAAFAALYFGLGRAALGRASRGAMTRATDRAFLPLLVVVLVCAVFTEPNYALLQALAYPVAWIIARCYRDAVLWSAAIALGAGLGMFAGLATANAAAGLTAALIQTPLSFVFAVAMGTWITRLSVRGDRYRELAEQLRNSQAEVAALSAAAGAATERERLSRELHDTLTQTLTGLVMLSEQAERALDAGDAGRARDRLDRVSAAAREAVTEARALVANTQPLGDGGLRAAIERVAARLRADTELRVECELETVQLDREREVVMLRAAQEGLSNARRHSRAKRVGVSLSDRGGAGAVLLVEDDGVGPGATGDGPAGFGLSGLGDRVRAVGGEVRFAAGAAGGSRLEVRLPATGGAGAADPEPDASEPGPGGQARG